MGKQSWHVLFLSSSDSPGPFGWGIAPRALRATMQSWYYLWLWLCFQCPAVPGWVLAHAPPTLSIGITTQKESEGCKALVEKDPNVPA